MTDLNKTLVLDALTFAPMGVVLILSASTLSSLLSLPQNLLFTAGCVLLQIGAFMSVLAAWQARPWSAGVWLVILGNTAGVMASLAVLVVADPNVLGAGLLIVQALVVALLALAESNALARGRAVIA